MLLCGVDASKLTPSHSTPRQWLPSQHPFKSLNIFVLIEEVSRNENSTEEFKVEESYCVVMGKDGGTKNAEQPSFKRYDAYCILSLDRFKLLVL